MPLDLDNLTLAGLVEEVAPLVARTTGWDLGLETLRSCVLPKRCGYEEILLGRLRDLGFQIPEDAPRDLFQRLLEYLIEANVLAAYQPGAGKLLVLRENVDDSNLDGLRVVLAHELVHRGQHVNHPEIFQRVEEMLRGVVAQYFSPTDQVDLGYFVRLLNEIRPYMTLMESHATYVQQLIASRYFPEARIETHHSLPVLLFRLFGGQKLSQYTDGLPAIAAAARSGEIVRLYHNPELVFGARS